MENETKLPRDYDGTKYGIDLNGTQFQKMAEAKATHEKLQEVVYGWLKGTTVFIASDLEGLTYADFVEHIGCDAQEYRFKTLGSQRAYLWIACDKPTAKLGAFFRENENGEWVISSTGSTQVQMPQGFIDSLMNDRKE